MDPTITFPYGFDERDQFEAESRGYLGHVVATMDNGKRYGLFFYDPVRLSQDIASEFECGGHVFWEKGIVVVPSVNLESITKAVADLYKQKYFDAMLPLPDGPYAPFP